MCFLFFIDYHQYLYSWILVTPLFLKTNFKVVCASIHTNYEMYCRGLTPANN